MVQCPVCMALLLFGDAGFDAVDGAVTDHFDTVFAVGVENPLVARWPVGVVAFDAGQWVHGFAG